MAKVTVNSEGKTVVITQDSANSRVIQVVTAGPKGDKGEPGSVTSSYSITSSYSENSSFSVSSSYSAFSKNAQTASIAITASHALNARTASYSILSQNANNATTASYILNAVSASLSQTARTASYVETARTASFVQNARTASYVLNAVSSSYATTSSLPLQGIVNASAVNTTLTFTRGNGTQFNVTVSQSGSVESSSYAMFADESATASYVEYNNVANKPTLVSSSNQIGLNEISGSVFSSSNFTFPQNVDIDGNISVGNTSTSIHQFTGSIIITGSGIGNTNYIDFNTTSSVVSQVGRMTWNDGDGTLEVGLKGGNSVLQLGQEIIARVYNAESTPLTDGQIVFISGSQGNRVSVKLASAATEFQADQTLGMVTEPIAIGAEGFITLFGVVNNLNTNGLVAGDELWLGVTPGTYTQIRPSAPNHGVRIGYVERVHPSVGSIYVKVDTGNELYKLHDVIDSTTSNSYGDLLYKSGSVWISGKQLTGSYVITGSLTATNFIGSLIGTSSQSISSSYALTASYISNAQTASYVLNAVSTSFAQTARTASYVQNAQTASFVLSSSYAQTASYVLNAVTASHAQTSQTASYVTTAQTASYVENAITASFVQNSQTASYVLNAVSSSYSVNSSLANTASYVLNAVTASFVQNAQTASYILNAVSSSFATTASFAQSARTASYVQNAQTASFVQNAVTASYVLNSISSSFSTTASFAQTSLTASYVLNAVTASFVTTAQTASYVENARTASYILNAVSSSYAITSSLPLEGIVNASAASTTITFTRGNGTQFNVTVSQSGSVESSSYAVFADNSNTASYVQTAQTASYVLFAQTSSYAFNASTASYILNAVSSSYSQTASYALNAVSDFPYTGSAIISGSLLITGSINVSDNIIATSYTGSLFGTSSRSISSSFSITASFVQNAQTASYVLNAVSTSFAQTASYILNAVSSSFSTTASFAQSSRTASYVENARTASYVLNSVSSSYSATSSLPLQGIVTASAASTTITFTRGNGTQFSVTVSQSGSVESSSYASFAENAASATSASYSQTASYALNAVSDFPYTGSAIISGSLTITGSLFILSDDTDGNIIGETLFTGPVTASLISSSFIGNLTGTASRAVSSSYALTASYALNGGSGTSFPYTGSAIISGSLIVTGSTYVSQSVIAKSFTGSLFGTASQSVSSSYALTASYARNAVSYSFGNGLSLSGNTVTLGSVLTDAVSFDGGNANSFNVLNAILFEFSQGVEGDASSYSLIRGSSVGSAISELYLQAGDSAGGVGTLRLKAYDNLSGNGGIVLDSERVIITQLAAPASETYELVINDAGLVTSQAIASVDVFPYTGSAIISGSLLITGSVFVSQSIVAKSFTGSLFGTASQSVSASFAQNARTASYVLNAVTASYIQTAQTASYVLNSVSASYALTSSLPLLGIITASASSTTITFTRGNGTQFNVTVSQSGSVESSSYASFAENAANATSASYASTASYVNPLTQTLVITGSIEISGIGGNVLEDTLFTGPVTASIISSSQFIGNLIGTASYASTASYFSGSISNATSASYALTASYALNGGSSGNVFPYTGSAIISGSLTVTGSFQISSSGYNIIGDTQFVGPVTASIISSSFIGNLTGTASIATTASYVTYSNVASKPIIKSGIVAGASFTGTPLVYTVTFSTPFQDNNYSVVVSAEVARTLNIQSKVSGSFVINTNSNVTFSENVFWQAMTTGSFG